MITKEYGKYIGVCDVCGEVTPKFDTFGECREYMKTAEWQTHRDKATGEWENICPECKDL